jgi:antibiotic biosynthesis monooxygenase (ABM) superfamily enzyme
MKRRTCLQTMFVAAGASAAGALAAGPGRRIQLHVDLAVDPAKEKEMLHNFETIFRPEAAKYPGYIGVEMLKLRTALQGSAPAGVNYRFSLTYRSEELRQKWVASAEHKRVWPTIENTLSSKNYTVLLFDVD